VIGAVAKCDLAEYHYDATVDASFDVFGVSGMTTKKGEEYYDCH